MKTQTTQRAVKDQFDNVIYCSYCSLQHLLKLKNATYYTARREGWASDIYIINPSTAVVTGYAPFGNIKADSNTCKKYEQKAIDTIRSTYDYKEQIQKLDILVNDFIIEMIQNV